MKSTFIFPIIAGAVAAYYPPVSELPDGQVQAPASTPSPPPIYSSPPAPISTLPLNTSIMYTIPMPGTVTATETLYTSTTPSSPLSPIYTTPPPYYPSMNTSSMAPNGTASLMPLPSNGGVAGKDVDFRGGAAVIGLALVAVFSACLL